MINNLKTKISKLDEHTFEVVRKSSSSVLVKIFGMLLGFGVSIVLGRTIGAEGLGVISLANQIVEIVVVVSMLGMNNVVLKEISIAFERQDFQHIANTIYTALWVNIPIVIVLSIFLIIITPILTDSFFKEPDLKIPLIIGFAVMTPQLLSRIFGAAVNGYRKIWQSNLVNNTLSIGVVAIGLIALNVFNKEITLIRVAILYAIGRILVTISIGLYWKQLFRFKGKRVKQTMSMLKVAIPLLIVSATSLIAANTDVVMLGWLSNVTEVGLYSVAARLGLLTSVFHIITISALTPKVAALYAENKKIELQIMIQQVTKVLGIIGVLSVIGFVFFGIHFLQLWGEEFLSAYWILVIIAIGQFFNLSTGATGVILMMTGFEKILGYITLTAAICNLILNYILIQYYGAIGAAIATAFTVFLENLLKVILVKLKTGISTIPFKYKIK